jgi:hypothetical protein
MKARERDKEEIGEFSSAVSLRNDGTNSCDRKQEEKRNWKN